MGDPAEPEITWSPEQWERLKDAFSIAIAYGPDAVEDGLQAAGVENGGLAGKLRRLVEQYHRFQDADAPAVADLPSETVIAGRFRVVARLGGGGFGDVYRVADLVTGVDRALKGTCVRPIPKPFWTSRTRFAASAATANTIASIIPTSSPSTI